MKYVGLIILALVLGVVFGSQTSTPTWPFTAISIACLLAAAGYSASVVLRAVGHVSRRGKDGDS